MTRLSVADPATWMRLHHLQTSLPPDRAPALYEWIHAQHLPTAYERDLAAAFDKLTRQHLGTNETWLAVSGPSHLGKSTAITRVLLDRATAHPQPWRTRTKDGYLHTPCVYVEAGSKQEARGLLASVARFCALPDTGSEKELHQMLGRLLPAMGVELVVVDDAQMYRRVSDSASRLTDGLRTLLHLPVPFAFVGIDLDRSALLRDPGRNNDTAQQLRRRHIGLRLNPIRTNDARTVVRLIASFVARMRAIEHLHLACLQDPRLQLRLVADLEGRPGSILNTLKRAAVEGLADNDGIVTADHVDAEIVAVQSLAAGSVAS
ncbi:AAA family ATPase [Nocardioides campestrisoli]|uniref:AAA family ATPase n=1 Tax=Nocardioides campestrisoli TaxID=2736757 RepID=UPI00163DC1B1|nr:AAA family ATPase [Nocardioides campestrisoli]